MTWERVTNQAQTDMFCSLEKEWKKEGEDGGKEKGEKKEERERERKEGRQPCILGSNERGENSLNGIKSESVSS